MIGSIYIGLCLILSFIANQVEKRTRRSPKISAGPSVRRTGTDTQLIVTQIEDGTLEHGQSRRLSR